MRSEVADRDDARAATLQILDRRLHGETAAPVAIALSGGGDSMALLRMARRWADRSGRPLTAFTIDHQLQSASAAWAAFAADACARLGVAHRTLTWSGAKPTTGLQAAARVARHRLIATAARQAGAGVVLMGHTADDLLEAALMREAGAATPSPREWAPSPVWPEGRGVFLLRPLLGRRRAELREWLRAEGATWVEDPANDDPRYGRTLARRRLAAASAASPPVAPDPAPPAALAFVEMGEGGELWAPRQAIAGAEPGLLAALVVCAAGTGRPPRGAALARLVERLAGREPLIATLAGARIEADAAQVVACREAGELARRGVGRRPLLQGESVFDGRFQLHADAPGLTIGPLAGHARRLPAGQRSALRRLPAAARSALPLALSRIGEAFCPILAQDGPVTARPLALARLRAALGAIGDERALARVAEWRPGA